MELNKQLSLKKKKGSEPWSIRNAWISLRNDFNSLVLIDENSGSPVPLTLAKYEAIIVDNPPKTATAGAIYSPPRVRKIHQGEERGSGRTCLDPAAAKPVVNAPNTTCSAIAPLMVILCSIAKTTSSLSTRVTTNNRAMPNRKRTSFLISVFLRRSSIYSGL